MQEDDSKIMMDLIDKLCDHLPNDRIKLLIDNGFQQWETITYMKGIQLIELGFDSKQVIIIMIAINSNAKAFKLEPIFTQAQIQQTVRTAKQHDQKRQQEIKQQQQQLKLKQKYVQSAQMIQINQKQYPYKLLTQAIMLKSIAKSSKQIQKPILSKITLFQFQSKQLTHLSQQEMKKIPSVTNLYLAQNFIYKIQGINILSKVKILRLENNMIRKMEGLEGLVNLERLTINDNYITHIQGLHNNTRINYLDLSNQKHQYSLTFQQSSFQALAYCLQKLQCNNNRVRNIDVFKHLTVVQQISLKNNSLSQIGQLTTALTQMQRLKKVDFKGNPLTKVAKYRDYIVILSKSIQQLDTKQILPKQRQYLVKLYSLKHAKQQKEQFGEQKKVSEKKILDLQGMKLQEHELGQPQKYVHGTDLRGNVTHANTKVNRK